MRSMPCTTCGHETRQRTSNQRYCRLCRLAKDLEFWGAEQISSKACHGRTCEYTLMPLHRSDHYCPQCCIKYPNIHGNCVNCNEERYLYHTEIPWCWTCIKSSENRATLVRWVVSALRLRNTEPNRILLAHGNLLT